MLKPVTRRILAESPKGSNTSPDNLARSYVAANIPRKQTNQGTSTSCSRPQMKRKGKVLQAWNSGSSRIRQEGGRGAKQRTTSLATSAFSTHTQRATQRAAHFKPGPRNTNQRNCTTCAAKKVCRRNALPLRSLSLSLSLCLSSRPHSQ